MPFNYGLIKAIVYTLRRKPNEVRESVTTSFTSILSTKLVFLICGFLFFTILAIAQISDRLYKWFTLLITVSVGIGRGILGYLTPKTV